MVVKEVFINNTPYCAHFYKEDEKILCPSVLFISLKIFDNEGGIQEGSALSNAKPEAIPGL